MPIESIPTQTEVLIIGAGPAGSTLAYELALSGAGVLLVDKAKFPRGKTCAGGINVRALRLLPFDISPVVERDITGITFTRNLEEPFFRPGDGTLMVTVRRERFDEFLVRQAEAAGARFFDQTRFISLTEENGGVEVATSSGACRAQWVIGADGANSAVAKRLGLMNGASSILAIHSEVPGSLMPWVEPNSIHIDWGSLKRGYAYLFPKKDFFSLGAGGFGLPAARVKHYHRAFLATYWHKEEPPPFSAAGFVVPLRLHRQPIQSGRCLLIGDAAGLMDPFTGEGIYSAIRSAKLVAPLLLESLRGGQRNLRSCQEAIDLQLMPELECSKLFREIFNLRPSFFHRRIAARDRWWNGLVKILRGEKTFLEVKKRLGVLGSLLHRICR